MIIRSLPRLSQSTLRCQRVQFDTEIPLLVRCMKHKDQSYGALQNIVNRHRACHDQSSLRETPTFRQAKKWKTPPKIEWKDIVSGDIALRPKKEKYHSVRTPRYFLRERHSYRDVAASPPEEPHSHAVATHDVRVYTQEAIFDAILGGDNVSLSDIDEAFCSLSFLPAEQLHALIQSKQFATSMSKLVDSGPGLSQERFENFVFNLASLRYKLNFPRSLSDYFVTLHDLYLRRFKNLPLRKLLKLSDAFLLLGVRKPNLMERLLQEVSQSIHGLSTEEFVQAIFLMGQSRQAYAQLASEMEAEFLHFLRAGSLSFIEVGTICAALYRSNWKVSSVDLMNELRDLLFAADLSRYPSYHIVGVLKVFRHHYYGYSSLFESVGEQLSREVHRYPVQSVMQLVLSFATLCILNEDLMDAAAQRVIAELVRCRSKDVSKLLWSFATLDYVPSVGGESLFGALLARTEELSDEMRRHPVHLISSLVSLAYMNIYPTELLSTLFSPQFLQHIKDYEMRKGLDLRNNLFVLDSSAHLECPQPLQQRLDKDYLVGRPFPPVMFVNVQGEIRRRPELQEVIHCLEDILGGSDFFRVCHILPYIQSPDIEICLDETHRPMPTSRWDENGGPETSPGFVHSCDVIDQLRGGGHADSRRLPLREVPDDGNLGNECETQNGYLQRLEMVRLPQLITSEGITRIAVQVTSRNHHRFGGTKLLGLHSMKRRHLKKLGYHVVEVPYHDWEQVGQSGNAARRSYLRRKVFRGTVDFQKAKYSGTSD